MEIQRYMRILMSHKLVVFLTAAVALLAATFASMKMAPVYSAIATMRVAEATTGSTSYQDVNYSDRLIQTYVHLLKSRPFLETTISRLNLPIRPDQLDGAVTVAGIPSTELITITVNGSDPKQAANIANTLGTLLVEQGQKVYSGEGKSAQDILQGQLAAADAQLRSDRALLAQQSTGTPAGSNRQADLAAQIEAEQRTYDQLLDQYNQARMNEAIQANSVSLVDPAVQPSIPVKPRIPLNLALGTLLGLVGGTGLALLLESLRPAVHHPNDVLALANSPVIGRIPRVNGSNSPKGGPVLLRKGEVNSGGAEAFRRLGSNVLALANRQHMRQLLVTAAEPEGDQPAVVANLAVALAQSGEQVILVDSDLSHPSLHTYFDLPAGPGLAEIIRDPSLLEDNIVITRVQGVMLVRAGGVVAARGQSLSKLSLGEIARSLASQADFVIWNAPPVEMSAATTLLTQLMDGVILIVTKDRTSTPAIELAIDDLSQAGAQLLGVIFNHAGGDRAASGHAYKYKYGDRGVPVPASESSHPPMTLWEGTARSNGQNVGKIPAETGDHDLLL